MVTNPVQPLSPDRLVKPKAFQIPNIVIMVVNRLINENWDGLQSRVWQSDIIINIGRMTGIDKETILHNRWLNIEALYREVGYIVNYVTPAPGERGDAYFEFIPQAG